MFSFFANKLIPVYSKQITQNGAGDSVELVSKGYIKVYIEPADGENLTGTEFGDEADIKLVIYTAHKIFDGDIVCITSDENDSAEWFEIRHMEFYNMPFLSYYKGYLVKADENIRI